MNYRVSSEVEGVGKLSTYGAVSVEPSCGYPTIMNISSLCGKKALNMPCMPNALQLLSQLPLILPHLLLRPGPGEGRVDPRSDSKRLRMRTLL